jgi:hypothetical protein
MGRAADRPLSRESCSKVRGWKIHMRRRGNLCADRGLLMLLLVWGMAGCASASRAREGSAHSLLWNQGCDKNPSSCAALRDFCELHPERCFGPMPTKEEESSEVQGGPPPSLGRCLDACAAGGAALRNFCRSIRDPQLKAGCWGLEFVGETACRGWCFWHY